MYCLAKLSNSDVDIVNLGLKFRVLDLQILAANIENVISRGIPENTQEALCSACTYYLNKQHRKLNDHTSLPSSSNLNKNLMSLRCKDKDNDLVVTKADKGNCVVVMNREQYDAKVFEFLISGFFKLLLPLIDSSPNLNLLLTKLKPLTLL